MWIDINVHLELMSSSVGVVLREAQEASVRFIATGTDPIQWKWLHRRVPYAAFGLHPHKVIQGPNWLSELEHMLIENPLSPVGEIGLDYRPKMPSFEMQRACFEDQLRLAIELDRPAIIHAVKAHRDVIASLTRIQCSRFVIHAFNGSHEIAEIYLNLGGYLSASGLITRIPAPKSIAVFQSIPKNRILIETDSPDLPPLGINAGAPKDLPVIGRALATILGVSEMSLQHQVCSNVNHLFDFDFAQLNSKLRVPP